MLVTLPTSFQCHVCSDILHLITTNIAHLIMHNINSKSCVFLLCRSIVLFFVFGNYQGLVLSIVLWAFTKQSNDFNKCHAFSVSQILVLSLIVVCQIF